jgi:hypothetical protein
MKRISSPSYLLFGALAATSALLLSTTDAFTFPSSQVVVSGKSATILATRNIIVREHQSNLFAAGDETDGSGSSGVVELADDDEGDDKPSAAPAAPFLSQGESMDLEEALNPDLSDPKQTRVILYIIISLVPVLFLVPLMLGSRDLIPLESLPPVDL